MFAVIFEVQPRSEHWDDYLGIAGALRPELTATEGFLDNIRYGSKRRPGWLLSLSTWRDEKALVRWRVNAPHHAAQEKGRGGVFSDYHLRVGQVTADTRPPEGQTVREQRLDETEDGAAKVISIVQMRRGAGLAAGSAPEVVARHLGLDADAPGLVAWDVFEAILTPGDWLLLTAWRDAAAADAGERAIPPGARHRRVRVVRDYGMFRRREAPQYYPEVARPG